MELVPAATSQVGGSALNVTSQPITSPCADNVDKKPNIYDLTNNNNINNKNTSEGTKEREREQHVANAVPVSPQGCDQKSTGASPVTPDSSLKDSCNSSLADDVIKTETSTPLKPENGDDLTDIVHPTLCSSADLSDRGSSTASEYGTPANLSFLESAGSVQYMTMKTSPYLNSSLPYPGSSPSAKCMAGLASAAGVRCPPVREAVDPAKYITISGEPDGVKYACSKCGNIYKWRKSLNKHWKEKHDGEAPDPSAVSAATNSRYPRLPPPTVGTKRPSPAVAFSAAPSSAGARPLSSASRPTALRGSLAAILPPSSNATHSPVNGGEWNQTGQLKTPTFADYKIPSNVTASPFSLLAVDAASSKERPVDLSGSTSRSQSNSTPTDALDCGGFVLDLSKKGVTTFSNQSSSMQDEPIDFSTKTAPHSARNSSRGTEMTPATFGGRPLELAHAGSVVATQLNCAQCRQKFTVPSKLNRHFADTHADLLQATAASGQSSEMSYAGSTQLYRYLTTEPVASRQTIRCVVCGAGFLWRSAAAKHFDQEHVGLYPNPYQVSTEGPSSLLTGSSDRDSMPSTHSRPGMDHQQLPGSGNHLRCGRCPFTTDSFSVLARHHLRHSPRRPTDLVTPDVSRIIWGGAGDADDMKAAELQLLSAAGATAVNMDDVIGENTAIVIPQAPEETATTVVSQSTSKPFKQSASRSSGVRGKRSDGAGSSTASAETLLPFKCELCEYRARWPSEMTQHAKNHSDEKPYHCPQCTYRSKWKWDVVKHLKRCGGGGTARDVIDTTNLSTSVPTSSVPGTAVVCQSSARRRRTNVRSLLIDVPAAASPASFDRGLSDVSETLIQPLPVTSALSSTVSVREQLSNGPPNVMVVSRAQDAESSEHSPADGSVQGVASTVSMVTATVQTKPADVASPVMSLVNQGLHYCLQCSFVGHSPAELRRHLRVHSDEKPYSCRTCCYSSKWKCDLKKHLRAYNHVSAVPLAYGGHGRKPMSDWQPVKQGSGADAGGEDENEMSGPTDDAADRMTPDSGTLSCAVASQKPDEKDSMPARTQRMPNSSNFGGITAGGRLRCRRCDFEAIDLTSFLQHKSTHAASRKDDNCGDQQGIQAVVTSAAARPSHHRRKSSKQVRVPPESKMDKYADKTAPFDVVVNYAKQQNDDEVDVPDAEDGSKFWTSLGLRSKNGVSCVQSPSADTPGVNGSSAVSVYCNEQERTTTTDLEAASSPYSECIEKMTDTAADANTPSPAASSYDTDVEYVDLDQPVDLCRRRTSPDVDEPARQLDADVSAQSLLRQGAQQMVNANERVTTTEADDATGLSKRKRKLRTCDKCGYVTDNLTTLQRHAAKHGSTGRHRCSQCDYTVDRQHILDYHVKNVHVAGSTVLLSPNATSVISADGQKMTMNVSDEETTVVDEDDDLRQKHASFSPAPAAKQRRREETVTSAAYSCISCGYSGHSVGAMTRHRLSHSSWSLPHRCHQCSRRATTRSLLLKHVITHDNTTAEKNVCRYCPYKSSSALQVSEHEHCHAADADGRYKCRQCSYKADSRERLVQHRRLHASSEAETWPMAAPLPCSECPFTSLVRDELTSHGRQHAVIGRRRRQACDRCSFAVDSRNALLHHRRLHDQLQ